jgi:Crp-like helix-turn-helix domain
MTASSFKTVRACRDWDEAVQRHVTCQITLLISLYPCCFIPPADAVAVTESTIAVVPQADILGLLRRHPEVCIDVIRLFASRLRAYKQVIEDLVLRTVVARVARLLVDHARGAHTLVEESANRRLDYTQDEIATTVGSVREVVQRALKALDHAGLVESERGRIHVIDVEALSTWTEQTAVRPPRSPVAASR